jgi:hypothetical protein
MLNCVVQVGALFLLTKSVLYVVLVKIVSPWCVETFFELWVGVMNEYVSFN